MTRRVKLTSKAHRVSIMLDSGVFSAWNLRKPIDLSQYIEFVKRNEPWLMSYVNFDEIPGEFGKKRTKEQLEASAGNSYTNLQRMLDAGLKPIPVFHQGESFSWFEKMLKDGHDYIGISTAKDMRPSDGMKWLNDVFSLITDAQGRPLIKTHGFGITKPKWLLNYPWFTTDSTTWALSAGYGICYIPQAGGDSMTPNMKVAPVRVIMSGVQQKGWQKTGATETQKDQWRRIANSRQFEGLGDITRKYVENYITNTCEIPITIARNDPDGRRCINLKYYQLFQDTLQDVRFKQIGTQQGFLAKKNSLIAKRKYHNNGFRVVFATNMQTTFTKLLMKMGCTTQLVSYFEFVHGYKSEEQLREYVETGLIPVGKRATQRASWDKQAYLNRRSVQLYERLLEYEHATDGFGQGTEGSSTITFG